MIDRFKKLVYIVLIKLLFSSFNTISDLPEYVTFYVAPDGTINKCHRSEYLEMRELLGIDEKIERLEAAIYYTWEKDNQIIMSEFEDIKCEYSDSIITYRNNAFIDINQR